MREFISIVESAMKLDEIFGLSKSEKSTKALNLIRQEIEEALKNLNIFDKAKAIDVLVEKALALGAEYEFFQSLGFKSACGPLVGSFYVPDIWKDFQGAHRFRTSYAVECLVGPLNNKVDRYSFSKYTKQRRNQWEPDKIPDMVWFLERSGSGHSSLIFYFKN